MVERVINRDELLSGDVQQVRPFGLEAKAQSMQSLSNTLGSVANTMQKQALDLAILDFNSTAADEINKIYYSNPAEPEDLRKQYDAYWKGYSKNVPLTLRGSLQKLYSDLSEKYVNKALSTKAKNISVQREEKVNKTENAFYRHGVELTSGIISDDPAEQQMAAVNLLDILDAHNNLLNSVGAEGEYLFTAEQKQKRQQDLMTNILQTNLQNSIINSPNPLEIIERIESDALILPPIAGVSTENVNISAMLNPESKSKITKAAKDAYMDRIRSRETILNIEQKESDRIINKAIVSAALDIQNGGTGLPKQYAKVLNANATDINQLKQIAAVTENKQTPISDMNAVNEVKTNIGKGIPQKDYLISNRNKFSPEDYDALIKENNLQFGTPSNPYEVGAKQLLDLNKIVLETPGAEYDATLKMAVSNTKITYDKLYRDYAAKNPNTPLTFEVAESLKDQALAINLDAQQRYNLGLTVKDATPEKKREILKNSANNYWNTYYAKKYPKASPQKINEILTNDPIFQGQINSIKKQLGQ